MIGRRGPRAAAVLTAAAAVAVLAGCSAPAGPSVSSATTSASTAAADGGYGALPAYLPKSATRPDATLTGEAHHPALSSEGVAIRVRYGSGTVLATVVGPVVPGEGLPFQAPATTCTWTVTLTGATTAIPVRARDFTTLDEQAHRYTVGFAPGAAPPPAVLRPGHSVTFRLRGVMATGEGVIRWAPGGPWVVGTWDFVVEND